MEAIGPAFSEEHMLADRSIVRLRLIRPDDADELRRGFERLSPESRYRRFLSGVHQLSDEALRYLTHVDERDHLASWSRGRAPTAARKAWAWRASSACVTSRRSPRRR